MVRARGLEPPQDCSHMDLNHARLPIPPCPLKKSHKTATKTIDSGRNPLYYRITVLEPESKNEQQRQDETAKTGQSELLDVPEIAPQSAESATKQPQCLRPGSPDFRPTPTGRGRKILEATYSYQAGPRAENLFHIKQAAMESYNVAKRRARLKNIPFTLTLEEMHELILESNGCCAITGIRFSVERERGTRRPWIPSIDQKKPGLGYTKENCRLVCSAVNIAMNEWGEGVLYRIARALGPRWFKEAK
jgi:hypothetical protein